MTREKKVAIVRAVLRLALSNLEARLARAMAVWKMFAELAAKLDLSKGHLETLKGLRILPLVSAALTKYEALSTLGAWHRWRSFVARAREADERAALVKGYDGELAARDADSRLRAVRGQLSALASRLGSAQGAAFRLWSRLPPHLALEDAKEAHARVMAAAEAAHARALSHKALQLKESNRARAAQMCLDILSAAAAANGRDGWLRWRVATGRLRLAEAERAAAERERRHELGLHVLAKSRFCERRALHRGWGAWRDGAARARYDALVAAHGAELAAIAAEEKASAAARVAFVLGARDRARAHRAWKALRLGARDLRESKQRAAHRAQQAAAMAARKEHAALSLICSDAQRRLSRGWRTWREADRAAAHAAHAAACLLYTSPSPRDRQKSRMPSSA